MRLGLMAKFSVISALVLLFTMGIFSYFNVLMIRWAFMEVYTSGVDSLSETILRTTHNAMLAGKTDEAYQAMGQAGAHEDIKNIRLIDKSGIVRFSLLSSWEVNKRIDKNTEAGCRTCHMEGTPRTEASTMDRSRIFVDKDGQTVLGLSKGIYNQPSCYLSDCHYHSPKAKMLGVLEVIMSLKGIFFKINTYRGNVLLELVFLVLAIALCMYLMIGRLIIQPLNTLLEHTRSLSRGEYKLIENQTDDEIGQLAGSFNEMTVNLNKAREDSERWASTLESRVDERTKKIQEMQEVIVRSEKLASLGELSAGIAHELNNPLTGIILNASILDRAPGFPASLREELETITGEAQRCARIVRNLLDFSRKTEPQKAMSRIKDVIERALDLVKDLSAFQNITIVREYSIDVPDVLIDPGQMEQVFINMFVNASQAMEEGGVLTVMVGLDPEGKWIVVQVKDSGQGIRKEYLSKIFDPFFSTKGPKGTGLGLSVSYGIIEGHGGTIEVQSLVGKGTTFLVKLPV